jgi:DNA replication protein DnaC
MSQTSNMTALNNGLKKLYLSTIKGCYSDEADLARQESLSYELYLQELVVRECEERGRKRITRYLRESQLPMEKNLDSFDRSRLPPRINGLVNALLDGSFLERCENILAFGNPGSGKTHLLCAIAQELINRDKRIFFTPCSMLVQNLLVAKREIELPKLLKKLSK